MTITPLTLILIRIRSVVIVPQHPSRTLRKGQTSGVAMLTQSARSAVVYGKALRRTSLRKWREQYSIVVMVIELPR
jgi:hypothetical protein